MKKLINEFKIKYTNPNNLKPYENNPRINDLTVDKVCESIKEFGFTNPILVDPDMIIIAGHTRRESALKLGLERVPYIINDTLTQEQVKAYRIADNKLAQYSDWDINLLKMELDELAEIDFDLSVIGFDAVELDEMLAYTTTDNIMSYETKDGSLAKRFVAPPFSVLDVRQGYWIDRKREWLGLGIKSECSREGIVTIKNVCGMLKEDIPTVSVFDPVLCECMYKWFNIKNGSILDPFAGGSVRGIVAEKLGYKYTGIELREEQVQANFDNARDLNCEPTWINDDSLNMDNHIDDNTVDMIFTCPPYANLEVYSDMEEDLSNMEYDSFLDVYGKIIKKASNKLKDDRFFIIVVGEVRDKKTGVYKNFVADTIQKCIDAGLRYYNEMILITSISTLALRAARQFNAGRKIGKGHQNVLVFYKGNPKNIRSIYSDVVNEDFEENLNKYLDI